MNEINLEKEIECDQMDITQNYRTKGFKQKEFSYASTRNIAEGMMDLALLTANANQLRYLVTYNSQSSTFYISLGLIILSLVLQVAVGIALVFQRQKLKKSGISRTNHLLTIGVLMVTFVNILIAALTSIDKN